MDETQDNRTLHSYEVESDGCLEGEPQGTDEIQDTNLRTFHNCLQTTEAQFNVERMASEDARFEESTSSQEFSNEGITSSEPFDHNEAVILSEEHNHNEDISPGEEYECHNASAEASDHGDEVYG